MKCISLCYSDHLDRDCVVEKVAAAVLRIWTEDREDTNDSDKSNRISGLVSSVAMNVAQHICRQPYHRAVTNGWHKAWVYFCCVLLHVCIKCSHMAKSQGSILVHAEVEEAMGRWWIKAARDLNNGPTAQWTLDVIGVSSSCGGRKETIIKFSCWLL